MRRDTSNDERATQLEVAVRQLVTAVKLFFSDGDIFSTYSLSRNAEEIISTILKENGKLSLWDDILENYINPEYKKDILDFANDPRNAMKHRIVKEDEIISFPPALVSTFLNTCVNGLQVHWPHLWEQHPELGAYMAWTRTHQPDIFLVKIEPIEDDKHLSKQDFFEKYTNIHKESLKQRRSLGEYRNG